MNYLIAFMLLLSFSGIAQAQDLPKRKKAQVPEIASGFWRICEAPDLAEFNGPDPQKQQVVDHGFVRDDLGTWQLWACIRGTKPGRLLYGWEGTSLNTGPWRPTGIKVRAQSSLNEKTNPESIQAPYFIKNDTAYLCFYNSAGIRLMTSGNGRDFERHLFRNGNNILYDKGGRDVMVLQHEGLFYAYSTVTTVAKDGWLWGFVILRTSKDLKHWSDYSIVSQGGKAGNGPVSAESPFVVFKDGYFYLFRATSTDGQTYVYRSDDPFNFGNNNDEKLITVLPVKAPEIILDEGKWYISDLADFKGIKLAELKWNPDL